ncbi:uncharacterized protein LOC144860785 [Branchiostoma floridae x Branchiostoma japonicum]
MGESGLIVNYPVSSEGCTLWQLANNSLFGSFALDPTVLTASVLRPNKWNYVGVTYDVTSGETKLWHQGVAVDSEPIGNTELNISGPIRLGYRDGDLESRAFHGRIACLQIYNYALEQRQIRAARHACDGEKTERRCSQVALSDVGALCAHLTCVADRQLNVLLTALLTNSTLE